MPSERIDAVNAALVRNWLLLCRHVQGSLVAEHDGLLVTATRLPTPTLNPTLVLAEPADAVAAVGWAEEWRAENGVAGFGVDLPAGRFPAVEAALDAAGYRPIVTRPAMTLALPVPAPEPPPGVDVVVVRNAATIADWRSVQVEGFGMPAELVDGFVPDSHIDEPLVTMLVGYDAGRPVASAVAVHLDGVLGIYAVATVPDARRRRFGTLVTEAALATGAESEQYAFLLATELGEPVYRAMGFTHLCDWVVWEKGGAA